MNKQFEQLARIIGQSIAKQWMQKLQQRDPKKNSTEMSANNTSQQWQHHRRPHERRLSK